MESDTTHSRLLAVVVALVVAGVAIAVGAGLSVGAGLVLEATNVQLGVAGSLVLALVLVQGVAFGGISLAFLEFTGRGRSFVSAAVPDGRDVLVSVGGYVLAFAAVFAGAMVATAVSRLLGTDTQAQNRIVEIGIESPEVLLLLVPMAFLLIGPGEELLFRGVVQGLLRERFSAVWAIVVASVIFAAIHYAAIVGSDAGRIAAIVVLFFPSVVLGALYEYTDNLVVPALVHALYDATLFLGLYVVIQADLLEEFQSMAIALVPAPL
jgi:membrane protease YdiL (CAAX protease family)